MTFAVKGEGVVGLGLVDLPVFGRPVRLVSRKWRWRLSFFGVWGGFVHGAGGVDCSGAGAVTTVKKNYGARPEPSPTQANPTQTYSPPSPPSPKRKEPPQPGPARNQPLSFPDETGIPSSDNGGGVGYHSLCVQK